jgi:hypothetical protein
MTADAPSSLSSLSRLCAAGCSSWWPARNFRSWRPFVAALGVIPRRAASAVARAGRLALAPAAPTTNTSNRGAGIASPISAGLRKKRRLSEAAAAAGEGIGSKI